MNFSFTDIFSLIYVAFAMLFAIFLLTKKSKNRTSNILLACFLFIEVTDGGGHFYSALYDYYPGIALLINELVFIKLPLLYLYVLSVIYTDFKLKSKHLLHLIPYMVVSASFIPEYFILPFNEKIQVLESGKFDDFVARKISYIAIHLQILAYYILTFRKIAHYKKLIQENYTNFKAQNYRWIFQFVVLFASVAFIATIKNLFLFFATNKIFIYAQAITNLAALFAVMIIVIKALQSATLFTGIDLKLKSTKELLVEKKSEMPEEIETGTPEEKQKIESLLNYIKTNKPYLNSDLTLFSLAELLQVNSRELSILINHTLGFHFFDFINRFRIDEAKTYLTDKSKDLTIQQIYFEVGFNSKSSFNTAFKKYTGTTPTAFKNSIS